MHRRDVVFPDTSELFNRKPSSSLRLLGASANLFRQHEIPEVGSLPRNIPSGKEYLYIYIGLTFTSISVSL